MTLIEHEDTGVMGRGKTYRVTQDDPIFLGGVAMFDLVFLGPFFTKMGSFCAHQTGNFLNFSKLTLLLSVPHF